MLINKLPVIILSSKRTGSTALAYDVFHSLNTTTNNLKMFNEPGESNNISELVDAVDNNEPYVLKVHAGDLVSYPDNIKDVINKHNCFLIRIRRKDIVAQLVSTYIAFRRNKWIYSNDTVHYNNNVQDIDPGNGWEILEIIKYILSYNKVLDEYPANFDLDLYYEDLEFFNNTHIKTPKPENYNSLYETMEAFYSWHKKY